MITLFALLLSAPGPLDQAKVEEHLGQLVPQDILLTDHTGRSMRFSELLQGHRPIILALAYYRCPMLCSMVLNGVARAIGALDTRPGKDFDVITVSFDPSEGFADASKRRATVLPSLPAQDADRWPFFVADAPSVASLLSAAGVSVAKDRSTGEWAHPAVFLVLTPEGRISRYFYGFETRPFDLELALAEAGLGKSGASFTRLLLRCFSYDPAKRRYAFAIESAFRAGGVALLLIAGCSVGLLFRREKRRRTV